MSKIINAVLSRFSAKYKSIDELGKLYLTQLQTKDYAAKTIQNKTCYVNHVCRLFNGLSVSQSTSSWRRSRWTRSGCCSYVVS